MKYSKSKLCIFKEKSFDFSFLPDSTYRWRSTHCGDFLDAWLRAKRDGIGKSDEYLGMEMSQPFSFHIRRAWLQLFLLGLSIYFLVSGIRAVSRFPDHGTMRCQSFRLTHSTSLTSLHKTAGFAEGHCLGETFSGASPYAVSVRLLRRGCDAHLHVFKLDSFDCSASLVLAEPLKLDGIEVEVTVGLSACPVIAVILAQADARSVDVASTRQSLRAPLMPFVVVVLTWQPSRQPGMRILPTIAPPHYTCR